MGQEEELTNARLTTPRAAAIAGILFSVLLLTSLVLIRISLPAKPGGASEELAGDLKTVTLALNLVPFAGIAFLWFIGVLRDRLGRHEDRFFATVFFGSGLLFLAMLFASAAVAGGVLAIVGDSSAGPMNTGIYVYGRTVTYIIMTVYAMKMAGAFMISTSTMGLKTGIIPRWMALIGLVLALFLLLSLGYFDWSPMIFPLWVLMVSVYILLQNYRAKKAAPVPSAPVSSD
jgi:hypothetical protein